MKSLYFFFFASLAMAASPGKKTPLQLAPSCQLPANAGSPACLPTAENRLVKDAKAETAPYQVPGPDRSGPRDIACKITSDCPRGQFCSAQGMCGFVGTNTTP